MDTATIKTIVAGVLTLGVLALMMHFGYSNGFDLQKDGTTLVVVATTFFALFGGSSLIPKAK